MTLEDLLAKFVQPKQPVQPMNQEAPQMGPEPPPMGGPGFVQGNPMGNPMGRPDAGMGGPGFGQGNPMSPQFSSKDNFGSTSPSPFARTQDPSGQIERPIFAQPGFPGNNLPGGPQFSPQQINPSEDRLARIEEKLKVLSDKIDLMAQQVSVVWELERRKMH